MKNLYRFILLLLLVFLSSCRPEREVPVNEGPTLFSRLGDSEYWREQYSEARWKEKEAKRLQYFYEKPLIDEPDIAFLQPFIKQWLDFYHLDLRQARVMGSGDMPLDRKPDKETIHYIGEYSICSHWENNKDYNDYCFFYAPNKVRYINYGYDCWFDNGEFELLRDVEQPVVLVDKKKKLLIQILYLGVSSAAQDVFWIDNDRFVIVGCNNYPDRALIWYFDIKKSLAKDYEILPSIPLDSFPYYPSTPIQKAKTAGLTISRLNQ